MSRSVEKKDSLVYTCTAHNEGNKASAYIRLSVIGAYVRIRIAIRICRTTLTKIDTGTQ
jgi:hypothetical protein